MTGPGGAFALASIQLVAGTFVFLWAASLRYRFIGRGYYRSTVWVLWPLMLGLALLLPAMLQAWGLVAAGLYLAFLLAVYSQRPLLEWLAGGAATATSVWLIVLAGLHACDPFCGFGLLHGLLGGLVLGAVTHGMVLGHWYLNQARMPIKPLREQTWLIIGLVVLSAAAGIVTRSRLLEGAVPAGLLAYTSAAYWWTWLLMLGTTGVLMGMVRATVNLRSTQSATGLLYIAGLTALAGQFLINLLVTT